MTKIEKQKLKQWLDRKVENYNVFVNRDDFPERPCVRKNVNALQNSVFILAECLYHCGFISFEECCEYWSKVGFVDEYNEKCKFTDCGANKGGICEYTLKEREQ